MFTKLIPYDAAYIILEAYLQYHHLFKRITKRAKIRFEHRDWHGIQEDARSRLTLYRDSVGDTTDKLLSFLGERRHDREIWQELLIVVARFQAGGNVATADIQISGVKPGFF